MTMKQFYSVPIGTCVRCGPFGTGVVAKREMVDTFLRRFDGKIGLKLVEPGREERATRVETTRQPNDNPDHTTPTKVTMVSTRPAR